MNDRVDLDRQGLAALLERPLAGNAPPSKADSRFVKGRGPVKTYSLEVNAGSDQSTAAESLHRLARATDLIVRSTADPTLFVLESEALAFFVDILDPRYWLFHTASASGTAQRHIRRFVWDSPVADWCWFPVDFLSSVHAQGTPRWFKADFKGAGLLPAEGVRDRRLRVQLEGEQALALLEMIQERPEYRSAAALTSIATHLAEEELGVVDEILHYNGRFVARGTSFELHVGFVAEIIESYASMVQAVESRHRLSWHGDSSSGLQLDGDLLEIRFVRPMADLQRFLQGLFSCRDPFRLWAVPKQVTSTYYTAEVVDLHIGERFSMDITSDALRIYLGEHTCGNTALRLLANLQHYYDAAAKTKDLVAAG